MYCGFIALFREAEGCQTQPPIVYSVIVKLLQNLQRNNLMFFHLRDVLYFYVEKKKIPVGKEEGKLSLFPDDVMLYIETLMT